MWRVLNNHTKPETLLYNPPSDNQKQKPSKKFIHNNYENINMAITKYLQLPRNKVY